MLLWPSQTDTQLSPVAPRSWFFPVATPRATATTGGLNQVRVSGVVCVFIPGTSAPFPLFLLSPVFPAIPPLFFPPHSPSTSPPPHPLSSSSYSCFYPSSSPSILTLPAFFTVEKTYGEGDMQSHHLHCTILGSTVVSDEDHRVPNSKVAQEQWLARELNRVKLDLRCIYHTLSPPPPLRPRVMAKSRRREEIEGTGDWRGRIRP
ncbi:unnamed protein product [Schistocephalus solidus]|uniref:Uncharacterized protein n=1 Tax=Schistocephalus solidus TaxID=70667 RepID=A0A183SN61_SCHSO|nr:unnamed protein product [Schistocephalus solidus]